LRSNLCLISPIKKTGVYGADDKIIVLMLIYRSTFVLVVKGKIFMCLPRRSRFYFFLSLARAGDLLDLLQTLPTFFPGHIPVLNQSLD